VVLHEPENANSHARATWLPFRVAHRLEVDGVGRRGGRHPRVGLDRRQLRQGVRLALLRRPGAIPSAGHRPHRGSRVPSGSKAFLWRINQDDRGRFGRVQAPPGPDADPGADVSLSPQLSGSSGQHHVSLGVLDGSGAVAVPKVRRTTTMAATTKVAERTET
jgi:hypothetical protein